MDVWCGVCRCCFSWVFSRFDNHARNVDDGNAGYIFAGAEYIFIFVPWTIRNYNVYREFIPTNLASGFNLLAGNHPGANGEQEPYATLDEYVKKYGYVEANRRASSDA